MGQTMPHPVADMLLVSHKAMIVAKRNHDKKAMRNALELAAHAMTSPGSVKFFKTLADSNMFDGNDPDVLSNDVSPMDPDEPDVEYDDQDEGPVDEDSDAASPADEGLVDHDQDQDGTSDDQDADPANPEVSAMIETAARNLTI